MIGLQRSTHPQSMDMMSSFHVISHGRHPRHPIQDLEALRQTAADSLLEAAKACRGFLERASGTRRERDDGRVYHRKSIGKLWRNDGLMMNDSKNDGKNRRKMLISWCFFWDIDGIYPLVMTNRAMEIHHF